MAAGIFSLPGEREAPVGDEGQVVVAPARDAGAERGAGTRGEVVGVRAGEHGPVRVRDEVAQHRGHLGAGDGTERRRLAVEELGQRGGPAHRGRELLDVLRAHARGEVQSRRVERGGPGDRGGRQAPSGQQGGAGQRVRAAARPARRDERVQPERVEHVGDVGGHVRHPPSGPRRGALVAGPGDQDGPQVTVLGRLHGRRVQDQPLGRALVHDQRQAVDRAGQQEVDVAPAGQGDEAAFGVHQLGWIRSGVTSTATRRSSAMIRS